MRSLVRLFYLLVFTLLEYIRSGRFLVELIATVGFFYAFFLQQWGGEIDVEHFFTLGGVFTLAITLYTTSSVIGLGDRPQGYVVLSRRVGRTAYLVALYLSAAIIVTVVYLLISAAAMIANVPEQMDLGNWLIGTLPLLLNVGLFMALLLMLSPLVFPTGWRLFVLSLIALAFSGNFISGPVYTSLPSTLRAILSSLQTILIWPLVPVFSGFALAMNRELNAHALVVLVAQVSLLAALLGVSLYVFSQREMVFSSD
jgi:hypothetical protein